MAEFALIERYFKDLTPARPDTVLGIGDDAAVLDACAGQLVMTLDTLVAGVHFLADADPRGLGHKALAVNLSDLAAMGAQPAWALLSLTLPQADEAWLQAFCSGFGALAQEFGVQLVGGDTTQGPLSISVQLSGVSQEPVMRRAGARPGDQLFVTGALGEAALALDCLSRGQDPGELRRALEQPWPRVREGLALRGRATSCIDLSDGLSSDLAHICRASGCGARVHLSELPVSDQVREQVLRSGDWQTVIGGGDDYELCFSLPKDITPPVDCTWIGEMVVGEAPVFVDAKGERYSAASGFEHFSS